MYYASFGMLALILHLIINHDALVRRKEGESKPAVRYRHFLIAVLVYYLSDILWGFFAQSRVVILEYADTMVYFISMSLSVFLWTRYVVAYIDRKGRKSASLLYAGCGIFAFVLLHLLINFFNSCIFSFDKEGNYTPGSARYIIFIVLFLLHLVLTVYSFFFSSRSQGKDKIHYMTVGASGAVMAVFIILQTMYPLLPFYAIGLLVSMSIIHVFVEEDEKMEMNIKLHRVERKAEMEHMLMEREKKEKKEYQEKHVTFGKIAESLASNYDVIYYVDTNDGNYVGYTSHNIFGQLSIEKSGDDFFGDSRRNVPLIVHPMDVEQMMTCIDKDFLLSALEDRKQYSTEYRLIVNDKARHTRLTVRKSSDSGHFIIGVENIDDEVRKEREHLSALNTEKELARRDELTGTKNKKAYSELEQSVQKNIEMGTDYFLFAIAICDINDLKIVNDTRGHKAGDEYIKAAAAILCNIFDHSPVFRIGGDEFVVFLKDSDYDAREDLIKKFKDTVLDNLRKGEGPVAAMGMSEYRPDEDLSITDVFERADNLMYEDKKKLKDIEA
ncbi:MAG: GGDEF domain-containing protein [Lachnospiraceae bacterium]|nr:GGDEF domain-containing protein [Lachnospiraceae bacterium]